MLKGQVGRYFQRSSHFEKKGEKVNLSGAPEGSPQGVLPSPQHGKFLRHLQKRRQGMSRKSNTKGRPPGPKKDPSGPQG